MQSTEWFILALIAAVPLAYRFVRKWIVLPIRLYRTRTVAMLPSNEYVTPEHITPELRELLRSILPQFQAEGFTAAASFHHRDAVPNVRAVQILLVNRATSDIAVIVAAWSSTMRSLVFAVQSLFDDDTSVSTGVNRIITGVPDDPKVQSVNFTWVKDAHSLCEAHRRRLRNLKLEDKPRRMPKEGDELNYVNGEWERACTRLVRIGYRRADTAAGVYRYTWKGAFLSTWKLIWPIKPLRIAAKDHRAKREWKSLGMDQWSPPATVVASTMPPPLAAATPNAAGDNIQYEVTLPDGEIRLESSGDVLTVRMGRPSISLFLARSWPTVLLTLLGIAMLASSFQFYLGFKFLVKQTKVPLPKPLFGASLVAVLVFVLLALRNLIIGVSSLRGTVVVAASPRGVTFKNAPDVKMHSGSIARGELAGLIIAGSKAKTKGPLRVLAARRINGRPQVLLYSKDADQLTVVRNALMSAMGIEGESLEASAPETLTT